MNFQEWIESQEFYDLCQAHRIARDNGETDNACEALQKLKIKILLKQKDSLIEQIKELFDIFKGKQL